MPVFEVDAVVVGGGHHGLVAAAVLADAGWGVLLLEAQPELGGAVRSTEWHPGFVADRFSAFYPLAAASPVLRALELERHGLSWAHAPAVLAHPLRPDGTAAAVLHRDPERTAAALDAHHPGDGAASSPPTPTSATARSAAARRTCSSNWCSGPCRASAGRRPRSIGSTSAARPRIRGAACTGCAGSLPRRRRSPPTVGRASCAGRSAPPRWRWCTAARNSAAAGSDGPGTGMSAGAGVARRV